MRFFLQPALIVALGIAGNVEGAVSFLNVHRDSAAVLTELRDDREIEHGEFDASDSLGGFSSTSQATVSRLALRGSGAQSSLVSTTEISGQLTGELQITRSPRQQHWIGLFGATIVVSFRVDEPINARFSMSSSVDVEDPDKSQTELITILDATFDELGDFGQGANIFSVRTDNRNPVPIEEFAFDEMLPPGDYQFQAFASYGFEGEITHNFRDAPSVVGLDFALKLDPIPEPEPAWLGGFGTILMLFRRSRSQPSTAK